MVKGLENTRVIVVLAREMVRLWGLDRRRCRLVPCPTILLLGHQVVTLVVTVLLTRGFHRDFRVVVDYDSCRRRSCDGQEHRPVH